MAQIGILQPVKDHKEFIEKVAAGGVPGMSIPDLTEDLQILDLENGRDANAVLIELTATLLRAIGRIQPPQDTGQEKKEGDK